MNRFNPNDKVRIVLDEATIINARIMCFAYDTDNGPYYYISTDRQGGVIHEKQIELVEAYSPHFNLEQIAEV